MAALDTKSALFDSEIQRMERLLQEAQTAHSDREEALCGQLAAAQADLAHREAQVRQNGIHRWWWCVCGDVWSVVAELPQFGGWVARMLTH